MYRGGVRSGTCRTRKYGPGRSRSRHSRLSRVHVRTATLQKIRPRTYIRPGSRTRTRAYGQGSCTSTGNVRQHWQRWGAAMASCSTAANRLGQDGGNSACSANGQTGGSYSSGANRLGWNGRNGVLFIHPHRLGCGVPHGRTGFHGVLFIQRQRSSVETLMVETGSCSSGGV